MIADFSYDDAITAAIAHHTAGQLDEAEALYRQILALEPEDPDALNLLGLVLQDRGDLAESISLLNRALLTDPDFPEALTNLARAQIASGNAAEAVASANRAVQADPELAEAFLQLGRASLELGDLAAAEAALQRCLALSPETETAWFHLGLVYARLTRHADAQAALRKALGIKPDAPLSLVALGESLLATGEMDAALELHLRAARIAPNSFEAQTSLATTRRTRLEPVESAEACRLAIAIDPTRSDVRVLLGSNQASLGDFAAAIASFRKALEINPESAEAKRQLSRLASVGDTESLNAGLEATLADSGAPDGERIVAAFTLGWTHESAADYDAAFAAFKAATEMAGARLAATGRQFDAIKSRAGIRWLVETFNPELFQRLAGIGDPSEAPVFIVGMPRSGTSLVEQIAASHPAVFGSGETKDIGILFHKLETAGVSRSPADWNTEAARSAAVAHIARLAARSGRAARVIDKLPDNIIYLGHIALLFPNARIVFCQRDLRDVCLSAWSQQFSDGMEWTYDLAHCAARAHDLALLTQHWRKVLPLRMLEVDYETLIADQETESRRLIEFLGLDWDPACLDFHQTQRPVMTASYWQVRQPIYAGSVGKWKLYGPRLTQLLLGLQGIIPEPAENDWPILVADPAEAIRAAGLHLTLGRADAAATICRHLLSEHPGHPDATHLLGLADIALGNKERGIAALMESAKLDPESAPRRVDLARELCNAGRAEEAIAVAREATECDPASADAWTQLGNAWHLAGDREEAATALRYAWELVPDSVDARIGLARALMTAELWPEAIPHLREILAIRPNWPEALVFLARALNRTGLNVEATELARRAAADEATPLSLMPWLIMVFIHLGLLDVAIELSNRILRRTPEDPGMWLTLGEAHKAAGRFTEAGTAFRQALAYDPSSGDAFAGLVWAGQATGADDLVRRASERIADETAPLVERAKAAFAIATSYEKQDDYDAAFHAYALGNQLFRMHRPTSRIEEARQSTATIVERSTAMFTPELFRTYAYMGSDAATPAFIVGMPRSGTTLVEQIAASHKDVAGLGERRDLNTILMTESGDLAIVPTPGLADGMKQRAAAVVAEIEAQASGARRIINKMPDNILFLGQIAMLFPRAKIIVCNRDLRDVCWSCYTQAFEGPGMLWTDTLEECAERAQMTHRLMEHWRKVLPIQVLDIQYETLVNDLEGQSRRLIDFLGLPWDPACLEFQKTERPVLTASVWQVRQPLYSTSVGRWRRYRSHLGPLLEGLKGLVPEDD